MAVKNRRLVLSLAFLAIVCLFAWYQSMQQVPDGQAPLATVHAGTIDELRADFNREADRVRMVVLLAPT